MCRKLGCILVASILFMSSLSHTASVTQIQLENTYTNSDVEVVDLVPDPFFYESPDVQIEGDSGEFTHDYDSYEGASDESSVTLTWNHTPGTELDFKSETGYPWNSPECNDFIYVSQEITWEYEKMPNHLLSSIQYKTMVKGDFANEEAGVLMFKLHLLVVDSSGNWWELYKSHPPYSSNYSSKEIQGTITDKSQIFGGMLETNGTQEDPEDSATLAIALSPTLEFESYMGTQPWEYYDGRVSFTITSVNMTAFVNTEEEPVNAIQPIHNNSWDRKVSHVFPDEGFENESAREQVYSVDAADDGSIYAIGYSTIGYPLYAETGLTFGYQSLTKFDAKANLQWVADLENWTCGHSVCVHESHVYTSGKIWNASGYTDSVIAKYTLDGELVWQRIFDYGWSEIGDSISVTPNGTIYVLVARYETQEEPPLRNSLLLKYSSTGELMSLTEVDVGHLPTMDPLSATESCLYIQRRSVSCRNFKGEVKWKTPISIDAWEASADGCLHTAEELNEKRIASFSKYSPNGTRMWSTNFSIVYLDEFYAPLEVGDLSIGPDGSTLGAIYEHTYAGEYLLVKLDPNGIIVWNKTITDSGTLNPSAPKYLEYGPNGLGYLVHSDDFNYNILIYRIDKPAFLFALSPWIVLSLAAGIAGIATVVALVYTKKIEI